MSEKNTGYIYCIIEREFLGDKKKKVYKIGKTTRTMQERMAGYSKGSKILVQHCCNDLKKAENELMEELKKKNVPQMLNIGVEYFGGNSAKILRIINQIIQKYQKNNSHIVGVNDIYDDDDCEDEDYDYEDDDNNENLNKVDQKDNENLNKIGPEGNKNLNKIGPEGDNDDSNKVEPEGDKNLNKVDQKDNKNLNKIKSENSKNRPMNKTKYACENCGINFSTKGNLLKHMNKKTPCVKGSKICEYCNKDFRTIDRCKKHINKCANRSNVLESKVKLLEEKINTKGKTLENVKNTVLVENLANKINKNAPVNANYIDQFVECDIKKYDRMQSPMQEDLLFVIEQKNDNICVPKLIELMHCNKNKPEFHNMYMKNVNSTEIKVQRDTGWTYENTNEFLFNLMVNTVQLSKKYCNENINIFPEGETKNIFNTFIPFEKMNDIGFHELMKLDPQNYDIKKTFDSTKIEICKVLVENKHMIKCTIDKSEAKKKLKAQSDLANYEKRLKKVMKIKDEND
jgi:hypothetical protein